MLLRLGADTTVTALAGTGGRQFLSSAMAVDSTQRKAAFIFRRLQMAPPLHFTVRFARKSQSHAVRDGKEMS
jgi:hypothetical protein